MQTEMQLDTPIEGIPWVEPMTEDDALTTLGLVEWLLKSPGKVDEFNRGPAGQRDLFPRLLLIAEGSFLAYALVMLLLFNLMPVQPRILPVPDAWWHDGSGLGLVAGYTLGVFLAAGVCLPSFYFYSLLAGVNMTWLQITSLIGKGTATNGIYLLGILPIYLAVMLGLIVFQGPEEVGRLFLYLGLALPFLSGLAGLRAIYLGIVDISRGLPEAWQCRRQCFLRRLTFAWAAVYTAVVPVMIYRLWEFFAELFRIG